MHGTDNLPARVASFLHHNILWLLIGSYVLAGFCPGPGLGLRELSLGTVDLVGPVKLTLPLIMLAVLLVNAGLGVRTAQLGTIARHPVALLAGLAGNLAIPIGFIFLVSRVMGLWHNPDEVQNILVGLALVASMPIAGSSTAWAQNTDGSMALSLGLVLGSTFLSPLTTPLALHTVGFMATGDYAEDLHELASAGSKAFLVVGVLIPSVLGIAARGLIGGTRIDRVRPYLKFVNTIILLVLNYSNASVSLPQAVHHPDVDFLVATLAITAGLCTLTFTAGYLISRVLRSGPDERASLMFGLGMNNNGTGLVLASLALADHPRVLLPLIFYNLVQHLVAGAAVSVLGRPEQPGPAATVVAGSGARGRLRRFAGRLAARTAEPAPGRAGSGSQNRHLDGQTRVAHDRSEQARREFERAAETMPRQPGIAAP